MKRWLVSGTSGSYSDSTWWPVAVFTTEERARDFATRAKAEAERLASYRCPRAHSGNCAGDEATTNARWGAKNGYWWSRHRCACHWKPALTLDRRLDPHNAFDVDYEIDAIESYELPAAPGASDPPPSLTPGASECEGSR